MERAQITRRQLRPRPETRAQADTTPRARIAVKTRHESRRFRTGAIEWVVVDQQRPAYTQYQIVQAGHVQRGAAFVIRFIGDEGNRTLYLYRSIRPHDQTKYIACRRENKIHELHEIAEQCLAEERDDA